MTPLIVLSGQARSGKDTAAKVLCERYNGVAVAFADPIKRFMKLGFGLSGAQLWGGEKEMEFHHDEPAPEKLAVAFSQAIAPLDLEESDYSFEDAIEDWLEGLPAKTTPRHMMQTFGTECVREHLGPDFWADLGLMVADELLAGGKRYTPQGGIFDATHESDVDLVVFTDGRFRNELLRVKQVGGFCARIIRPVAQEGLAASARVHASETEMKSIPDWWFDLKLINDGSLDWFVGKVGSTFYDRLHQERTA